MIRHRPIVRMMIVLATALVSTACSEDSTGPSEPDGAAFGVVLSSIDRTLTVFSVESPDEAFDLGLAPDGSPVTLAVRGAIVAVPLGYVPAVAIADLRTRAVTRTVPLPAGSGATGVAFLNDSIAIVANPALNTVTPVNVLRGTAGSGIAVGTYPQAAVAVRDTVFVLNANLGPDFSPAGPASISVITGTPAQVVGTIPLSGFNAAAGIATDDGRLLIVHSGTFGEEDGSVSVVSRATLAETRHVGGFGEFPGSIGVASDGRWYVGSFGYGISVLDAASDSFVRDPQNAIAPGGIASTAGLGFDEDGHLYALLPECRGPSAALRLTPSYGTDTEIPTGSCPIAIGFTRLP